MLIKNTLFRLIFVCVTLAAKGQNMDSLKMLLPKLGGAQRIDVLYELGYGSILNSEIKMAYKHCGEGYKLASDANDSIRIIKTGRVLASVLRRSGIIDSAINIYRRILPMARQKHLDEELKIILNALGMSYTLLAQYDKALVANFESLSLREQSRDTTAITIALSNIGFVYYKLSDYKKALLYFQKSFDLKRKIKSNYDMERTMVNISLCYAYSDELFKAQQFVDSALKFCGNACSDEILVEANFCLGFIYLAKEKLSESKFHFLKSYEIAKATNNTRFQIDIIVYLSQIYISENDEKNAIKYLSEAENLIDEGSQFQLELVKIYRQFSEFYLGRNFERTAFYQQKYIQLWDSVYRDDLATKLASIEVNYVEKENQAKIASQKQVIRLKEEVIRRQDFLNWSVSAIATMAVVLAIVLFKITRQKKMINELLEVRVRERTREFERNRNELIRACSQRDWLIDKTAQSIRSSLASIDGICTVGLKDISELGARQYLHKIQITTSSLSNSLNVLAEIHRR
jgi:hypothetical protein